MAELIDQLRVFIVADDPLARSGLVNLLAEETAIVLAGQAAAGRRLVGDLERAAPDAILWDLGWQPERALEFLRDYSAGEARLRSAGQSFPILALLPDEAHAQEARVAGVHGLLLRESDAQTLTAGLRAVAQRLLVFDPALAEMVLRPRAEPKKSATETLTPREMEVLQLAAEGLPNKLIAQRLKLSEHTVKFHLNSLMGKLGAQSRTEAVVRATRLGLIFL